MCGPHPQKWSTKIKLLLCHDSNGPKKKSFFAPNLFHNFFVFFILALLSQSHASQKSYPIPNKFQITCLTFINQIFHFFQNSKNNHALPQDFFEKKKRKGTKEVG